ncbi:response regulator, partial [Anaerobaca lacustris]|nr:response regulator [Sedimentisphaerales bacterium M17dextr]
QPNQQQTHKKPAATRGKRILVVDDNATNREILRVRLTSWGAEVVVVSDGPTALATMAQTDTSFDMVITDMQMPEMDGLTLGRAIRQEDRFKDIPLVMMTSLGQQNSSGELAEIGFVASLTKPIRPSELHTRLIEVLSGTQPAKSERSLPESDPTSISLDSNARILLAEDNLTN